MKNSELELPFNLLGIGLGRLIAGTFILFSFGLCFNSCTKDNVADLSHGYPAEIDDILRKSCATAGCHNAQSALAAANLNLETWEDLFKGSSGGSAVVPYAPEQSYLMHAINQDSSRGPILLPTMPIGASALTDDQFEVIRKWIEEGARNEKGEERFPPMTTRRKWYIAHQGCESVAVIDAESRQIMRYLEVGGNPAANEYLSCAKVSPDGKFWYAIFAANNSRLEKYSTLTDEKVGSIPLGHPVWNNMEFSNDGKFAFVLSSGFRDLVVVDLDLAVVVGTPFPFANDIYGVTSSPVARNILVPNAGGNSIFSMDYDADGILGNVREIDLLQGQPATNPGPLMPYDVVFSSNGEQFYVTCFGSNEVRIFDRQSEALIGVTVVGEAPTNLVYSEQNHRIFVACMNETAAWAGQSSRRGAIAVVDALSGQLLTMVYSGYQPHGIELDDVSGHLVIANRNLDPNGPAQHHASSCAGRNGNLTLLNVNTLQIVADFKSELAVDPLVISIKN